MPPLKQTSGTRVYRGVTHESATGSGRDVLTPSPVDGAQMGIFGKDIGSDITPSMRDRSITQQAGALVSIVVPSKNKTKDLSRLLETLEQQTVRPFEIIVVASGPTGDLDLIAARYNAVVAARDCGMSEARNIGASLATGRYLLFLDSDML